MSESVGKAAGALALAVAVVHCGGSAPAFRNTPVTETGASVPQVSPSHRSAPEPALGAPSSDADDASIRESLAKLEALNLFEVRELVVNLPAESKSCYGHPCPGDAQARATMRAERSRQAPRVASLAKIAEDCKRGVGCDPSTPATAAQALDALNALQIVKVTTLVEVKPNGDPRRYNVPTARDLELAQEANRRRAALVYAVARAASSL